MLISRSNDSFFASFFATLAGCNALRAAFWSWVFCCYFHDFLTLWYSFWSCSTSHYNLRVTSLLPNVSLQAVLAAAFEGPT